MIRNEAVFTYQRGRECKQVKYSISTFILINPTVLVSLGFHTKSHRLQGGHGWVVGELPPGLADSCFLSAFSYGLCLGAGTWRRRERFRTSVRMTSLYLNYLLNGSIGDIVT